MRALAALASALALSCAGRATVDGSPCDQPELGRVEALPGAPADGCLRVTAPPSAVVQMCGANSAPTIDVWTMAGGCVVVLSTNGQPVGAIATEPAPLDACNH